MELKKWLDNNAHTMTVVDFARAIGVQRCVIYWWCAGKHLPAVQYWDAISKVTRGGVKAPDDFLRKYKEYKMSRKKPVARNKKNA